MSPSNPSAPQALSGAANTADLTFGRNRLRLTHLDKLFWPDLHITKRALLQYYLDVGPVLLGHLKDRAMVMKRYPNGAAGKFFFMKHAPTSRPSWLRTCTIPHPAAGPVEFPMVQDLASLLWIINLGCIDLNPWYSRCDDPDRPDYLIFDLDPVPDAGFDHVREAALRVREALDDLRMASYAKTTGSRGIHVYVPIRRGPPQKQVWNFAKDLAKGLESKFPNLITAEFRVARRPAGRVLLDYNQNVWGHTLASVYSVRPQPQAAVSAPVSWEEVARGCRIEDFRLDNMAERLRSTGDLWKPLLSARGRARLDTGL